MRVAVFVDAGYLYAAGGTALVGSGQNRASLELVQDEAIAKLKATAAHRANGAQLLRIYWYDGALNGRRSYEQRNMAMAEDVKLKLGTVTGGRQKGVDSLIVTDLIELARNQVITDAVLLSGDEDLRVGVQIVQSLGVRVHLIGIVPSRGNQSDLLQEEADTITEWSKEDVEGILSVKPVAETTPVEAPQNSASNGDSGGDRDELLTAVATAVASTIDERDLPSVAEELSRRPPLVPHLYDRALLAAVRERLGQDMEESEKHRIRAVFREIVLSRV